MMDFIMKITKINIRVEYLGNHTVNRLNLNTLHNKGAGMLNKLDGCLFYFISLEVKHLLSRI